MANDTTSCMYDHYLRCILSVPCLVNHLSAFLIGCSKESWWNALFLPIFNESVTDRPTDRSTDRKWRESFPACAHERKVNQKSAQKNSHWLLDATSHVYKRVCPSVCPSIRLSIHQSCFCQIATGASRSWLSGPCWNNRGS